jgi:spore coat polysaccharide biosynthesis protein SpsF
VDHEADFRLVRAVFERLYPENPAFGYREVLELLEREPELREINRAHANLSAYKQFWN